MLDTDKIQDALEKARSFAKANNLIKNLEDKLTYLADYGGGTKTRCRLFPDFAPLSFDFTMDKLNDEGDWVYWFNGGLIFHGNHDGHGSGSEPTFAVTIEPITGWSIHT